MKTSLSASRKDRIKSAELLLIENGIDKSAAPALLAEIGKALLGRDVYDPKLEDKQMICSALCDAIILTSNGGMPDGNPLKELRYIPEKDLVRPIFEDGTGSNGYYDVNVAWDSGTALIKDVANQFIGRMW